MQNHQTPPLMITKLLEDGIGSAEEKQLKNDFKKTKDPVVEIAKIDQFEQIRYSSSDEK